MFDQFGQMPISSANQLNRAVKQARLVGPMAAPGMSPQIPPFIERSTQTDKMPMPQQSNAAAKGDLPFSYNPGPTTQGPAMPSGLPAPDTGQRPMNGEVMPPESDSFVEPSYVARERDMMSKTAQALVQHGSPAQRVQGLHMLMQTMRPSKEEDAFNERKRLQKAVDSAPADDAAKARARTMLELGADAKDVMETLGFDSKGLAAEREKIKTNVKAMSGYAGDMASVDILRRDQQRVIDLMDRGTMVSGLAGEAASYIPYSDAYMLDGHLQTFKSTMWKDYVKRMREESPTGAAVGQVTEKEGYWLQTMEGSLLPFQNPATLKQNMEGIIQGKQLFAELRVAAARMETGDEQAGEDFVRITREVSTLTRDIVERSQIEARDSVDIPAGARDDIEAKYGLK